MTPPDRFGVRSRALAVVLALACLTLGACGGGGSAPAASGPPSAQGTAGSLRLAQRWPLTGEPVSHPLPAHPVFVVKIDNTDSSKPQVGLSSADLVTEELVEGGITRLAVFFYSHIPHAVGPVRSMRASDIDVVKPTHGVLVASGGAHPTLARMRHARIATRTEGAPGFYRVGDRMAPYNLMLHLSTLSKKTTAALARQAKHAKGHHRPMAGVPPRPYLPFGRPGDVSGRTVTHFDAVFSTGHTTHWKWVGGTGWTRPGSFSAPGHDFVPANVLVLRVREGNAGYLDPAGNPVPETELTGSGRAMLFAGDQLTTGTWHKKGPASAIRLTTAHGTALRVPPGRTWIELVPTKTGSVSLPAQHKKHSGKHGH